MTTTLEAPVYIGQWAGHVGDIWIPKNHDPDSLLVVTGAPWAPNTTPNSAVTIMNFDGSKANWDVGTGGTNAALQVFNIITPDFAWPASYGATFYTEDTTYHDPSYWRWPNYDLVCLSVATKVSGNSNAHGRVTYEEITLSSSDPTAAASIKEGIAINQTGRELDVGYPGTTIGYWASSRVEPNPTTGVRGRGGGVAYYVYGESQDAAWKAGLRFNEWSIAAPSLGFSFGGVGIDLSPAAPDITAAVRIRDGHRFNVRRDDGSERTWLKVWADQTWYSGPIKWTNRACDYLYAIVTSDGNFGYFGPETPAQFGGGEKVVGYGPALRLPSGPLAAGAAGVLYARGDGSLWWHSKNGRATQIAPA